MTTVPRPIFTRASEMLAVLERDLAVAPLSLEVRVVDPLAPDAEALGVPDPLSWVDDRDEADAPILLLIDGSTRSFDADATDAELLAEFASLAQDAVCDETGRPWPELRIDQRMRVLDARVVNGAASWCRGQVPLCPIGELAAHL